MRRDVSTIERLSTTLEVQKQLAEQKRTICFFDIGIEGNNLKLGRIVFELYDGIVPQTCKNFAAFCRGVNGLSYKYENYYARCKNLFCLKKTSFIENQIKNPLQMCYDSFLQIYIKKYVSICYKHSFFQYHF